MEEYFYLNSEIVMGSKPIRGLNLASIAQLAVRGTYNAEVVGSSPTIRTCRWIRH